MDFRACLEVCLAGRWYTKDARHNHPCIGRIVMGRGRDATNVATSTAFGLANLVRFQVVTHEQAQAGSRVCRGALSRELSGARIIIVPRRDISVTARSTNSEILTRALDRPGRRD
jgi:hypothetical protein